MSSMKSPRPSDGMLAANRGGAASMPRRSRSPTNFAVEREADFLRRERSPLENDLSLMSPVELASTATMTGADLWGEHHHAIRAAAALQTLRIKERKFFEETAAMYGFHAPVDLFKTTEGEERSQTEVWENTLLAMRPKLLAYQAITEELCRRVTGGGLASQKENEQRNRMSPVRSSADIEMAHALANAALYSANGPIGSRASSSTPHRRKENPFHDDPYRVQLTPFPVQGGAEASPPIPPVYTAQAPASNSLPRVAVSPRTSVDTRVPAANAQPQKQPFVAPSSPLPPGQPQQTVDSAPGPQQGSPVPLAAVQEGSANFQPAGVTPSISVNFDDVTSDTEVQMMKLPVAALRRDSANSITNQPASVPEVHPSNPSAPPVPASILREPAETTSRASSPGRGVGQLEAKAAVGDALLRVMTQRATPADEELVSALLQQQDMEQREQQLPPRASPTVQQQLTSKSSPTPEPAPTSVQPTQQVSTPRGMTSRGASIVQLRSGSERPEAATPQQPRHRFPELDSAITELPINPYTGAPLEVAPLTAPPAAASSSSPMVLPPQHVALDANTVRQVLTSLETQVELEEQNAAAEYRLRQLEHDYHTVSSLLGERDVIIEKQRELVAEMKTKQEALLGVKEDEIVRQQKRDARLAAMELKREQQLEHMRRERMQEVAQERRWREQQEMQQQGSFRSSSSSGAQPQSTITGTTPIASNVYFPRYLPPSDGSEDNKQSRTPSRHFTSTLRFEEAFSGHGDRRASRSGVDSPSGGGYGSDWNTL